MDANSTVLQSIDKFAGINNVDDATRLDLIPIDRNNSVLPLAQASNVEIDDTYALKSRSGYTTVGIAGTNIHSLWSDGTICLYVDAATLYKLDAAYNKTVIRTGLTLNARMSYAVFNDRIYYTNYNQIGYVKNSVDNSLVDPSVSFKVPLPAGQLIAYFKGCLYIAKDSTLYISDPLCDYYDNRNGYKVFNGYITMLRPVDDGIYISDTKTWWMKGKGNDEFELDEAYPFPAVLHTDITTTGSFIDDSLKTEVAMWTSETGVCLGDNDGKVTNLTEPRYKFSAHGQGAAFIRDNSGKRHYINSLY